MKWRKTANSRYFEESLEGKSYYFTKTAGDTVQLHFAYLVDEDMVDGMALCLNNWADTEKNYVYLDISQI